MSRLTVAQFNEILAEGVLVYDGAMGTNLQVQGLSLEDFGGCEGCSEALNLFAPHAVKKVHLGFLEVGCRVIETNTFGGTRITLKEYDLQDRVEEINKKAVEIAKEAIVEAGKDYQCFIAASVGPTSALPTLGNISFDDMAEAYLEQFRVLWDAGVDIFQIETCQDLLQVKSALFALESLFIEKEDRCPVVVSVTLEATGTMLMGSDISAVTTTLEPYSFIDALSINCATGPLEMVRHVSYLTEKWPRAVGVMPNAGLPINVDGNAVYKMTPEEFSGFQKEFVSKYGVNIVGGCCGTRPDHLLAVVEAVKGIKPAERKVDYQPSVSSLFSAATLKQEPAPALVGERTNANGAKKFRDYLLENEWDGIVAMGREQAKGGAHLLDLCTAYVGRDEVEDFKELIPRFAKNVKLPLMIDSTSADSIEVALKLHGGRCVINSVNLEDGGTKLHRVAKLAKRFGAALICLTIDEEGMAKTAEQKVAIAKRIRSILHDEYGFRDSDLIFDLLTFTVGSGDADLRNSAVETLNAIEILMKEFPETNTILGVSNVSFGLNPAAREILNSLFLSMAVKKGLTSAIVNPAKILPVFRIPEKERKLAEDLLLNVRNDGSELSAYLDAFQGAVKRHTTVDLESLPPESRLLEKVVDGDGTDLEKLVTELREKLAPEEIINKILLVAMKKVGELFGSGQLQLPFVLQSAEVVKRTVKMLEPFMEKKEADPDRKVILATVAGDVHDIGKNLVNIMLSNNGYTVFDLGIKVDIDTMIKAAQEQGANVIGMSGLLVRSTQVMKENLEELNRREFLPNIILGGAALTADFVNKDLKKIYNGEVFYAKDAVEGLHILEKLISGEPVEVAEAPMSEAEAEVAESIASTKVEEIQEADNKVSGEAIGAANRHQFVNKDEIIKAPFFSNHFLEIDAGSLLHLMSHKILFEARWGYKKAGMSAEEYEQVLEKEARPSLNRLIDLIKKEDLFQGKGVYGYYRCQGKGDKLKIYDDAGLTIGEFSFPRQRREPHLCMPDYFSDEVDDVIALWAVTIGSKAIEVGKKLYEEDHFKDYHLLHGLGAELADCGAVQIHRHIHKELFPATPIEKDPAGVRYSFGYPSCPDLKAQKELLRILEAQKIGITLTEGYQMVPELSVSGFIVFNKHAKYFVP